MVKLVSFWALLALVALLVLQAIPYTGVSLMLFGAALLSGLLVHVFLVSLLIEAILGRTSRLLILVPLAAYGAYYAAYIYQTIEIAEISSKLRVSNPTKVLSFDPGEHSLVSAQASTLVQRYAVPVAYEANANVQPEGHLSFRLIPREQCRLRKDSQHRIQTFGMFFAGRFQQNVCVLRFPEAPPFRTVRAMRRGDDEIWKRKWGISEQVTTISVDGVEVGSYRTASLLRLPVLPALVIGCGLISSVPAWKCGADLMREHTVIDAVPAGVDREKYDSPISVMLGIRRYTQSDLSNFRGYPINDAALARIAGEPERVENEMFDALATIIAGKNLKPPFNLGFSLSQNPKRLEPFAQRMAARFVELNRDSSKQVPYRREQARALATAIVSLPRASFLGVSDQLFEVIQRDGALGRYPALYVRLGEAGSKTLALYKRDFMDAGVKPYLLTLPVLAICRVGEADAETVAEMKRRFLSTDKSARENDYKSALFVTLMKLGEERFLRDNIEGISKHMRRWADAVLEKKGTTSAGPNNCMALRWNNTDYPGPMMQPGLHLVRGAWLPRG